jgi:DNA-directed RNA polymerase specialized sigma24 family protein
MSDASRFDAFYAEARGRLLVQAYALTGDLPASRGAVRDAFIAAWHHWPKVRRLEDPEAWLRPHAWAHAQRRHTGRIWHRDRKLDPEIRSTLDALAKLPVVPRKALLLTQLSTASRTEMAREIGLTLDQAERRLQTATTQFSLHRDVSTTAMRPLFDQLSAHCADQRWPRATIVRRAGAARRRAHTAAGSVLVVAALVGSGFLVQDQHGVHPTLATARDRILRVGPTPSGSPSSSTTDALLPAVTAANLLTRGQLSRAVPGRAWRVTGTDSGHGNSLPCQQRRYADPGAQSALVRNFTAKARHGSPSLAGVQTMELSADTTAAQKAYSAAGGWFAGCLATQTQLLTVRRVVGLGDEAEQYALRSWQQPASTLVLGLARTGRLTTVTLTRTGGANPPDLGTNLRLLVSAVDDLCSVDGGGPCSAMPKASTIPAPAAGRLPMMLSEFDLPPAAGVRRAWVGTTPRQALQNAAATGCDASSFHGHGWRHDVSRSFVVPGAHLAPSFGLTETVGRVPVARAKTFVAGVRTKLASCPSRMLGTKVARLVGTPDLMVWRVRTQVTKKSSVTFFMGVARNGGAVAQVGFVPDGSHTMSAPQFVALVKRAQSRLAQMPS